MIWPKRIMADIVRMRTGKLDSNAAVEDGDYPFFTCAQQTLRIDRPAFDTEAVLLGGNNAAGVFPLKYFSGEFNAYQRTYIIETLDPKVLATRYLYHALRPALSHFQSVSIGAATQYLTKGILDNFTITLPPIETQTKIANILSTYDDLIENNRRRIQILEESSRLLYREWFVHLRYPGHEKTKIIDGVPVGWVRKELGKELTLKYGKSLKKSQRKMGKIPVFGSSGIVGYHDQPLINGPAIIVGRKGNVGSVYWSQEACHPIDTVYFIGPEQASQFLRFSLECMQFISTDVAVPGLNRDFAHSREFLVPPQRLLKNFEEYIDPMTRQIILLQHQSNLVAQSRDILLPKLMSGEITC